LLLEIRLLRLELVVDLLAGTRGLLVGDGFAIARQLLLDLLANLLPDGLGDLLLLIFGGGGKLCGSTFVGLLLCGQSKLLGCNSFGLRGEAALIAPPQSNRQPHDYVSNRRDPSH
jgi:hypothetical protein